MADGRSLAVVLVLLTASSGARAQTSVRVEFTSAGECAVTAQGPTGRAGMKSPLRGAELKCLIPLPRDAGAVELEVVMPSGAFCTRPGAACEWGCVSFTSASG